MIANNVKLRNEKSGNEKSIGFAVLGVGLLIVGLILIKTINESQGILQALPYICVGIGCGIFGHNFGELFSKKTLKGSPEIAKSIEIEQNDERNVMIANKAKSKAYEIMILVYGAIMVSFGLMQVDITIIIILAISYLFVVFSGAYFRSKYEKVM